MSSPAIAVQGLSKSYRIYGSWYDRFLEQLPWSQGPRHRPVHALQDVSFEVPQGSCVGLIGGNGAGKSTLLKILTGTTFPTKGRYEIRGRVASLLELGAGFHQDFTGRENVYMNAAMLGLSRRETQRKYEQILEFSELREFIDAPLRTYSSGMVCRLGFSVAVTIDPDVLIVDEILAVGDMHFQRKCVDRIWEFKRGGKTMFFCSHSLYDVRQICDNAIWLKGGRVQQFGDSVTVTNEYATYENQLIVQQDAAAAAGTPAFAAGDAHPRIVSAELLDPGTGEVRNVFTPGETVAVRVHVKNGREPVPLVLAVGFTRSEGLLMFVGHTGLDGVPLHFEEGIVTMLVPDLQLLSGEFTVPVWLLDQNGVHRFHERPASQNLIVQNRSKEIGYVRHRREWRVETLVPEGKGS
jgi:ABC-type polysaccharide/polyol phosphate transport system ATPase subunit